MNVKRGDVEIVGDESGAVLAYYLEEAALHLDGDTLRWLSAVAIPAVLATPRAQEPETSEAPEKVDGQIPGQTTIDEALAQA